MKPLEELFRPNIAALEPYSSARDEYQGKEAKVFLDANENPYNTPYNRYPDPLQRDLKKQISQIKQISEERIFLGNGSDEAIDLMYRIFCRPGIDNTVAMEPTYGMYSVSAHINDVEYRAVPTDSCFQPDIDAMLAASDSNTRLMFFCSPNNPTGNLIRTDIIERALKEFQGIVVVDEAYIDFAYTESFTRKLDSYPNLVILQTFSKAWGLAGIRLGLAFADSRIIAVMNKVKYPYNINMLTQQKAQDLLDNAENVRMWVEDIVSERRFVAEALESSGICIMVYPSDANFLLARFPDATAVYNYLVNQGIIVRNRSRVTLCGDTLRITIGTAAENRALLSALIRYAGKKEKQQ